jgi:hypothetical protein
VILEAGKNWLQISTSILEVVNDDVNKHQIRTVDYYDMLTPCNYFVPVCLIEGLDCVKADDSLVITDEIYSDKLPSAGEHQIRSELEIEVDIANYKYGDLEPRCEPDDYTVNLICYNEIWNEVRRSSAFNLKLKTCELETGLIHPQNITWRLEWHYLDDLTSNPTYLMEYEQAIPGCDVRYSRVITNTSRKAD